MILTLLSFLSLPAVAQATPWTSPVLQANPSWSDDAHTHRYFCGSINFLAVADVLSTTAIDNRTKAEAAMPAVYTEVQFKIAHQLFAGAPAPGTIFTLNWPGGNHPTAGRLQRSHTGGPPPHVGSQVLLPLVFPLGNGEAINYTARNPPVGAASYANHVGAEGGEDLYRGLLKHSRFGFTKGTYTVPQWQAAYTEWCSVSNEQIGGGE